MIQYKSINHQDTSLAEREEYFKHLEHKEDDSAVLLQTCNRVELYYGNGDVPDEVARHLFRVACGLESAIIGEQAGLYDSKAHQEVVGWYAQAV